MKSFGFGLRRRGSDGAFTESVSPAAFEKSQGRRFGGRFLGDERGQVLVWVVFLMLLFMGMCALTVDVGHGYLVKRELQASCDAAALAAAGMLPDGNYSSAANKYTSAAGSNNAYTDFTVNTPVITPLCLTTLKSAPWNLNCTSTSPNAVSVTQTATIHTFFAGMMGINNMTVSAESTASRGAKAQPYNVVILLDTTPSMSTTDNNCKVNGVSQTQLQCATEAFQYLLQGLDPAVDNISLFTFPSVTTSSVQDDYNCSGTVPTVSPYTFPSTTATSLSNTAYTITLGSGATKVTENYTGTYQITGFENNYRTSDSSTTLNSSSNLANAVGSNNCTGVHTSWNDTYYAGAIYAAQSALLAEQTANPGSENAMIILGDGNSNVQETNPTSSFSVSSSTASQWSTGGGQTFPSGTYTAGEFFPVTNDLLLSSSVTSNGTYPSWEGQCGQAVDAAQSATAQGTLVFTIAYGSSTSSGGSGNSAFCGSDVSAGDHKKITPCETMQDMSSGWPTNTSHFFSDYFVTGGDAGCEAAGAAETITSLQNIVDAIVADVSGVRLIPNGTT